MKRFKSKSFKSALSLQGKIRFLKHNTQTKTITKFGSRINRRLESIHLKKIQNSKSNNTHTHTQSMNHVIPISPLCSPNREPTSNAANFIGLLCLLSIPRFGKPNYELIHILYFNQPLLSNQNLLLNDNKSTQNPSLIMKQTNHHQIHSFHT